MRLIPSVAPGPSCTDGTVLILSGGWGWGRKWSGDGVLVGSIRLPKRFPIGIRGESVQDDNIMR